MNKACIFDFGGVMIDNERFWEEEKMKVYREVYGNDIATFAKTFGGSA